MSRVKLVDVAVDSIIEMIKNKQYDEKGYLPSEGDLAELLSVSRATIREAVRSLEVRGFLVRRHGKGVQIADNSVEVMTRSLNDMFIKDDNMLDELLDLRLVIEPVCAKSAAMCATKEHLEKLNQFITIMEKPDVEDKEYYNADLDFHITIAKASGNRIYEAIITAYTPILHELIVVASPAHCRLEPKFHYHRNILDAIKNRDGQLAEEEMGHHLKATDQNRKEFNKH